MRHEMNETWLGTIAQLLSRSRLFRLSSGSIFLSELVDLTGGSYYLGPVSNSVCANLAKELRVQYLIGYHPTNTAKDGKWRKLSVKVDSPASGAKLSARIKRGYYAAKTPR